MTANSKSISVPTCVVKHIELIVCSLLMYFGYSRVWCASQSLCRQVCANKADAIIHLASPRTDEHVKCRIHVDGKMQSAWTVKIQVLMGCASDPNTCSKLQAYAAIRTMEFLVIPCTNLKNKYDSAIRITSRSNTRAISSSWWQIAVMPIRFCIPQPHEGVRSGLWRICQETGNSATFYTGYRRASHK